MNRRAATRTPLSWFSRLRRAGVAVAAGSALALSPVPASAAAPAPVPGTYCSATVPYYSPDGYIYAEVQMCLTFKTGLATVVNVHTNKVTYKWGGVWYSASSTYPAAISVFYATIYDANGAGIPSPIASYSLGRTINQPGSVGVSQTTRNAVWNTPARAGSPDLGDPVEITTCGKLETDYYYIQTGPYWGPDTKIAEKSNFLPLTVPCQ
ncbi:hypothetical protein ACIG3E_11300 [Streptomyces sp. NPDC053474]|uniref:hypothetical protein n=1 Tax=Streptomyces sp. NPDC053474 TaxID=3365704 RepID=UPI0037CEC4A5